MKNKQRVPAPRGRQSDDLAAYEVGSGRISLRCASMTRKLVPNIPGIRGMSVSILFLLVSGFDQKGVGNLNYPPCERGIF